MMKINNMEIKSTFYNKTTLLPSFDKTPFAYRTMYVNDDLAWPRRTIFRRFTYLLGNYRIAKMLKILLIILIIVIIIKYVKPKCMNILRRRSILHNILYVTILGICIKLFCIKTLAEEREILHSDMKKKLGQFCCLFINYLSKIDLSIEDQELFILALKQNQKVIIKKIESLNTTEELYNLVKLIINELQQAKAMDNKVWSFLRDAFDIYLIFLGFLNKMKSNTERAVGYPKKSLAGLIAWIFEIIITIIIGGPWL